MSGLILMKNFPDGQDGRGLFLQANASKQIGQTLCDPKSGATCKQQVFVSLFFDGTDNHRTYHEPGGSYTNVARLFDACEGVVLKPSRSEGNQRSYPDEKGRYKSYLQGVPEIGEPDFSNVGLHIAQQGIDTKSCTEVMEGLPCIA